MVKINRIKIALVERDKTGKWLADTLGKDSYGFALVF